MSFLFPLAFIGLLAVIVPLVLHFIKKSKQQETPWAAMEFLTEQVSQTVRRHTVDQWFLLVARVLAILLIVAALAQPIGSLLDWGSQRPDTIVLMVDRGVAMGEELENGQTLLEQKMEEVEVALADYGNEVQILLMDSATMRVAPILSAQHIGLMGQVQPSQSPVDIGEMFDVVQHYLGKDEFGKTEAWLVTSEAGESWVPSSRSWAGLGEALQGVRVRTFIGQGGSERDLACYLTGVRVQAERVYVELMIEGGEDHVLLEGAWQDGEEIQYELELKPGQNRYVIELVTTQERGAGYLQLPDDGNLENNAVYFSYGPMRTLKTLIIAESGEVTQYLERAVQVGVKQEVERISAQDALLRDLSGFDQVIWASTGETLEHKFLLEEYVSGGGDLVIYPKEGAYVSGWYFTGTEETEEDFRAGEWRGKEGPWRDGKDAQRLPLDRLQAIKRAEMAEVHSVLATWQDGEALLGRSYLGRGALYTVATLPDRTWSNLENLALHLILSQRLLDDQRKGEGNGYLERLRLGEKPYEAGVKTTDALQLVAYNRAVPQESQIVTEEERTRLLRTLSGDVSNEEGRPMRPLLYGCLLAGMCFVLCESMILLRPQWRRMFKRKEGQYAG